MRDSQKMGTVPFFRPRTGKTPRLRSPSRPIGAEKRDCPHFLTLVLAAFLACAPPEEQELAPLETEDVGGAPDATADLSTDPIGPRPVEGLSGVLPSQFPRSVPIVTPSSLVDYGEDEGGRHILVMVGGSARGAEKRQLDALRSAGWTVTGGGGSYRASFGGDTVTLDFEDVGGATEIRFGY